MRAAPTPAQRGQGGVALFAGKYGIVVAVMARTGASPSIAAGPPFVVAGASGDPAPELARALPLPPRLRVPACGDRRSFKLSDHERKLDCNAARRSDAVGGAGAGMSGTGKSSALAELARRGHQVLDTDDSGWIIDSQTPTGSEPLWDLDKAGALLDRHRQGWLFVAGCVANQRALYD